MAVYNASYPWAKMELPRETSGYTNLKKIKTFCNLQVISKTFEKDIILQACELEEPICKNEVDD